MSLSEKNESIPMPSADINPGNALARVQECLKYMTLQQWPQFHFLYGKLSEFQDFRIKGTGKMLRDDDEFTSSWNNLRANSVDSILKNIESAQTFDEFQNWMKRLSEIVTDPRSLWNILHTEVQASLKVTLEQAHEISFTFFTPQMLFEFGLDSFLGCCLCDFTNIADEEALIDIFYATAGYIRACNLPIGYEVKAPHFIEFVNRMLLMFTSLPDFDAHRFIWLVEVIHNNFHMLDDTLYGICESVLKDFTSRPSNGQSLTRLHKMCIISTSPFMQGISTLKDAINQVFQAVLVEQRRFTQKYIFGCFVDYLWDGDQAADEIGEPLQEWKLYLTNLAHRIKKQPELPKLLLDDLIDNSLVYFTGYYGEVQSSKARSSDLRRDIFAIANLSMQYFTGKLGGDTIKKIWYLLYIAAVSGASDDQLKNVKQVDCKEKNEPFLGLAHTDCEFNNYVQALERLSFKFAEEFEAFPAMVDFVRKNY